MSDVDRAQPCVADWAFGVGWLARAKAAGVQAVMYLEDAKFILINGETAFALALTLIVGAVSFIIAAQSKALTGPWKSLLFLSPLVVPFLLIGWGVAWMPTSGMHSNPVWASYLIWLPLLAAPVLSLVGAIRLEGARLATAIFGFTNTLCCLFVALVTYMAVSSYWL